MRSAGFMISRLRITGPDAKPAELSFAPGLNVVSGASNTGKSYIVQCLNYMMGAQRPPKVVPEAAGYTQMFMELQSAAGEYAVLERHLTKGGNFKCYLSSLDEWDPSQPSSPLGWKHNPRSDATVSRLLLALCDLEGVSVRSNAAGKVRPLSFRDVCRFMLVDETRILSDWSPIHASGQLTKKTEDKCVFDFLVSGGDAGNVVAQAEVKIQRARWRAKIELYDRLIADLKAELAAGGQAPANRLEEVDQRIDQLTSELAGDESRLAASKAELADLLEQRRVLQIAGATQRRLDDLVARRAALGPEPKKRLKPTRPEPSAEEKQGRYDFCKQVEQILRGWRYPGAGVTEVNDEMDLVIGGAPRHTQGKGYRAILHAAFSLALMRQSSARHPGVLVLDSPLTSFKEKDAYEVSEDIQQAFYEDLTAMSPEEQILIFENKDPSPPLQKRINFVHFSGASSIGRSGFFPV